MQEDLKKALDVLKKGGVILFPTDTVWSIGCDATNKKAVERIYRITQRSDPKSMLVLLDHAGKLSSYVREMPDIAWDLIDLADKPLTLIYPQAQNLAQNLMACDGTIGIRITQEPFTQKLIERFRKPMASTSANINGEKSPGNYQEINPQIIDSVDYVVRWRQNDYSKATPSGIIKLGINGEVEVIKK
ncbi:MAG TPA: L-threonylcarbamoyladenylate synthase [Bacteroidales bacterium]|nr:L-threonylcarbamoyladenylate synthase [Bacteroidales bacterium]